MKASSVHHFSSSMNYPREQLERARIAEGKIRDKLRDHDKACEAQAQKWFERYMRQALESNATFRDLEAGKLGVSAPSTVTSAQLDERFRILQSRMQSDNAKREQSLNLRIDSLAKEHTRLQADNTKMRGELEQLRHKTAQDTMSSATAKSRFDRLEKKIDTARSDARDEALKIKVKFEKDALESAKRLEKRLEDAASERADKLEQKLTANIDASVAATSSASQTLKKSQEDTEETRDQVFERLKSFESRLATSKSASNEAKPGELHSRISQVEDQQKRLDEVAQELGQSQEATSATLSMLSVEVSKLPEAMTRHEAEVKSELSQVRTMVEEEKVHSSRARPTPQPPPTAAGPSLEDVEKKINVEAQKTGEKLRGFVIAVVSTLRDENEETAKSCETNASKLSEITQRLDQSKAERDASQGPIQGAQAVLPSLHVEFNRLQDELHSLNGASSRVWAEREQDIVKLRLAHDGLTKLVEALGSDTESCKTRLAGLDTFTQMLDSFRKGTELQIHHLVHWQDNFSSRTLAAEIEASIRQNMPGSVDNHIRDLDNRVKKHDRSVGELQGRVGRLEGTRSSSADPNKKRKLCEGPGEPSAIRNGY